MSPTSSGTWSGAAGADIIDLDRYMRGGVRPSLPAPAATAGDLTDCELVVDAGGVKARHKRFSHDSGVSDSSYSRRRRHARPHRARPPPAAAATAAGVEPTSTRTLNSSNSLREFRTICEQALLEQQRQIAHVAQLCERLTERAEMTERSDRPERTENKDPQSADQKNGRSCTNEQRDTRSCDERPKSQVYQSEKTRSYIERQIERRTKPASTVDVSDMSSSSSRSTKDPGRKDRHRTQQCKTYKIIMSKLDELNRLFSTRGPPTTGAAGLRAPRSPLSRDRRAPSSSSVTVCDKLVATEPVHVDRVMTPTSKRRPSFSPRACSLASRRVTHAYTVDIAPPTPAPLQHTRYMRHPNVVTESVVKCESVMETRSSRTSVFDEEEEADGDGDVRCEFDLQDPLYSQAKKLQALSMTTARTERGRGRSANADGARRPRPRGTDQPGPHSPSLCAACRYYWRSFRDCLIPQLFPQPDQHCNC